MRIGRHGPSRLLAVVLAGALSMVGLAPATAAHAAPVCPDASVNTSAGETLDILVWCTDADGDQLTLTIAAPATQGVASVLDASHLRYVHQLRRPGLVLRVERE